MWFGSTRTAYSFLPLHKVENQAETRWIAGLWDYTLPHSFLTFLFWLGTFPAFHVACLLCRICRPPFSKGSSIQMKDKTSLGREHSPSGSRVTVFLSDNCHKDRDGGRDTLGSLQFSHPSHKMQRSHESSSSTCSLLLLLGFLVLSVAAVDLTSSSLPASSFSAPTAFPARSYTSQFHTTGDGSGRYGLGRVGSSQEHIPTAADDGFSVRWFLERYYLPSSSDD